MAAALTYERAHFAAVAESHDLAAFGQAYYAAVAWATKLVVELRQHTARSTRPRSASRLINTSTSTYRSCCSPRPSSWQTDWT